MPQWPKHLLTPADIFHVSDPEALIARARLHMAEGKRQHPYLIWPELWRSVAQPVVYVNCGRWMISCATPWCGDCPIVHPGWRMAVCFECGAIYEHLSITEHAQAIEALLVARPSAVNRNWLPTESVTDLEMENALHGLESSWLG